MSSASVTDVQQVDAAAGSQGMPLQPARPAPQIAPLHDAAEAALRRRARRQGLLLMVASSAVMIALLVGIWLSFR